MVKLRQIETYRGTEEPGQVKQRHTKTQRRMKELDALNSETY